MARKNKKQSGGGLKGFILLAAVIVGALYIHQNGEKVFTPETAKAIENKPALPKTLEQKREMTASPCNWKSRRQSGNGMKL